MDPEPMPLSGPYAVIGDIGDDGLNVEDPVQAAQARRIPAPNWFLHPPPGLGIIPALGRQAPSSVGLDD